MNQILITQKLYITPELKRKKKMYKFDFILSLFLVIVLCSICIYAEYDRNKSEAVSQEILTSMTAQNIEDDTTIRPKDNVLVVALDDTTEEELEEIKPIVNNASVIKTTQEEPAKQVLPSVYTDSKGNKYATVGTINIPKINVNYPILSETSDELLKVSICKFWGPNPNEVGNLCLVGHNYRNSRFFSKVPKLENGDKIEIMDLTGTTVTYEVYDSHTVDPEDVSDTTQKTNGEKEVTLITCTNDNKLRVVVKAREIEE